MLGSPRLFAYVVARDFGFAPNPFYGVCTLATCKPDIRRCAALGDWVAGTGSARDGLHGRLIYAMRVEQAFTFDEYWQSSEFVAKRPLLSGSLKQMFGDNIYRREGGEWIQSPSHHSLPDGSPSRGNLKNDTSVNRVLTSRKYVYFGRTAPEIPASLRNFLGPEKGLGNERRGHRRYDADMLRKLLDWLGTIDEWGWRGDPVRFAKMKRRRYGMANRVRSGRSGNRSTQGGA